MSSVISGALTEQGRKIVAMMQAYRAYTQVVFKEQICITYENNDNFITTLIA